MRLKTFSPEEPAPIDENQSRMESVAGLLMALPPAIAESVLAKMGPVHSVTLREQMRELSEAPRPPESMGNLLNELERRMSAERQGPVRLPRLAAAPETKPSPRPEVVPPPPPRQEEAPAPEPVDDAEPAEDRDVIAKLRLWDAGWLAAVLKGEQPKAVAVILNCLDAQKAGQVLKLIPAAVAKEAFLSLIDSKPAGKLTVQIARTLMRKSKALRESTQGEGAAPSSEEKYRKIACVLRSQPSDSRNEMLLALEQLDAGTAAKVKDQLYTFEDILLLDDRSVQKVLRLVNTEKLTFALIGAAENIKEVVLQNLSKRASDSLREEIASRPTAPAAKVQEGQQEVTQAILQADAAGELTWVS